MKVDGSSDVILRSNTTSTSTTALVSPELKHTILVSWHDLISLGVIPDSFPALSVLSSHYSIISSFGSPPDSRLSSATSSAPNL